MSEAGLLVSTRKGLIIGRSSKERSQWEWSELQRSGWIVDYSMHDVRSGKIWCAANHWQWGPRLHYTTDWGESWHEAGTPAFADGERSVESIWMVEPGGVGGSLYAGIMPGALFHSADDGQTWAEVTSLTEHPYSEYWVPGAAGMMFHHICVDPNDPQRVIVGGSSTGIFASYDGGQTWEPRNRGIRSDHLPPDMQEMAPCIHSLIAHPLQRGRLWQQTHFANTVPTTTAKLGSMSAPICQVSLDSRQRSILAIPTPATSSRTTPTRRACPTAPRWRSTALVTPAIRGSDCRMVCLKPSSSRPSIDTHWVKTVAIRWGCTSAPAAASCMAPQTLATHGHCCASTWRPSPLSVPGSQ